MRIARQPGEFVDSLKGAQAMKADLTACRRGRRLSALQACYNVVDVSFP